ncbi:unnamed protein product, partial [Choristocarpus tenellus]
CTVLLQGNHERSHPLYQRSLAIREKVLGPDHPHLAFSLDNLAGLLKDQGNHSQAELLYQRSLAIREKVLGPDHPHVAFSLDNLARSLKDQGNYERAEPLYQRSLAIREKVLGPEHLGVASSLNNCAGLMQIQARKQSQRMSFSFPLQGNYERSDPLYQRSLAIREKVLGPDHPHVAFCLDNLASSLKAQ